jgi:hypothetical protein
MLLREDKVIKSENGRIEGFHRHDFGTVSDINNLTLGCADCLLSD